MPQIGQFPGSSRTTSGCIGQVYWVFVGSVGVSGSSAIPQLGQAPGASSRTSGHMGQTYALSDTPADAEEDAGTPWVESRSRYCTGEASNFLRQ